MITLDDMEAGESEVLVPVKTRTLGWWKIRESVDPRFKWGLYYADCLLDISYQDSPDSLIETMNEILFHGDMDYFLDEDTLERTSVAVRVVMSDAL